MRIFYTLVTFLFICCTLEAQPPANFWTPSNARGDVNPDMPVRYKTFALDYTQFKAALRAAPMEFSRQAEEQPLILNLPLPDGRLESFAVVESPTMAPELAARYPELLSFGGQGLRDRQLVMKFTVSPTGLQAILKTAEGMAYISPLREGSTDLYMSYFSRDLGLIEPFICGVEGEKVEAGSIDVEGLRDAETPWATTLRAADPVPLRTYQLALSCTGEFASIFGATTGAVMNAFNTAVNQLNLIFELEADIRFQLIPNNDILIFLDGATDPFDQPTLGRELLTPNNDYLLTTIGDENFDVGHIFTGPCTDIAGVAQLQGACGFRKGAGVTCFNNNNVVARVNTVMAHEIGHQFGATHTWNFCPGSDDQREGSTAFEPGSGTTIMSYAGVCGGGQNIISTNDIYFHNASLDQIYDFSRNGGGNDCPEVTITNNNTPDLTLPYANNFFIPIRTPFQLTAQASDIDGDQLTYCWEQYNTGPSVELGTAVGSVPLFRSFPPTGSPTRLFPRVNNLINNISNETEILPDYDRTLNFRCTVRDNAAGNGGVTWAEMFFKTTTSAGPFRVTSPNTSEVWEVGEEREIVWSVANTDNATVNCQKVNILLSVNKGFDFPITLAAGVPNDGSQLIVVPNAISDQVRIKVEAANNIFFDISNQNVEIIPASQPGLFVSVNSYCQQICLPDAALVDITVDSLGGFNDEVNFSVEGLPPGASAVFGSNPGIPSQGNTLTINMDNVTSDGLFEFTLVGAAPGIDTVRRSFLLDLVYNDFSELSLDSPAQGEQGVSDVPMFSWAALPNVGSVTIEIATDPQFGNIVFTESGISSNEFQPGTALEKNTTYYWRLIPVNECGEGATTPLSAFRTESLACVEFSASNVPLNISSVGMDSAKAVISSGLNGTVSDFNVKKVKGFHDLVKHIDVSVVSPSGVEVLLFSDLCGNTTLFDVGFDDQAASATIPCPPTDGMAYRPIGQLSDFNGQNGSGEWVIKAEVNSTQGNGGTLQEAVIEICSNVSLNNPSLQINEALCVRPGEQNPISSDFLLSDHPDNIGPDELVYTVLSLPANGSLRVGGTTLDIGSTFTQETVNNNNLLYFNDLNSSISTDSFRFDISGGGGWFGAPFFKIDLDVDCITSTRDLYQKEGLSLFPNPAQSLIHLKFEEAVRDDLEIRIYNLQGQLRYQARHAIGGDILLLPTGFLTNGMYVMEVQAGGRLYARKFNILR